MNFAMLMHEVGETATSITTAFSGLDFTAMVDIAVAIIPVALAAAIPVWSIKFGWNFLKSVVTGL